MVLIEIVEKAARADRMPGDLEIVNVPVPVLAHLVGRRHGQTIAAAFSCQLSAVSDCRLRKLIADAELYDPHDTRPRRADRQTFDVLVVGGGIYGLTIAYDAAQRGLSVALVERDDFGSGASFNHLRTIHGGLRYLQTLDIAPRARVDPRAPDARADRAARGPAAAVRAAALPIADARQAGDARRLRARSRSSPATAIAACRRRIGCPAAASCRASRAAQRFPGLRRQGLTGAAVFYDYVTTEPDRFTFSFALAAVEHGAVLANHVEAIALLVDGTAGGRRAARAIRSSGADARHRARASP